MQPTNTAFHERIVYLSYQVQGRSRENVSPCLTEAMAMVYSPADEVPSDRRSFLGALLAALPLLETAKGVSQPVQSETRWRTFLQILARLLELDAAAALDGPSQSFILKEFLAILATRLGCLSP